VNEKIDAKDFIGYTRRREQELINKFRVNNHIYTVVDDLKKQFKLKQELPKILLHVPDNGAVMYNMFSWHIVLNFLSPDCCKLMMFGQENNIQEIVEKFNPDVFITVEDPNYIEHCDLEYLRNHDCLIGMINNYHYDYNPDFRMTFHFDYKNDSVLIKFGDMIPTLFGVNPIIHLPVLLQDEYVFGFIGTNSHLKKDMTDKYLLPLMNKYSHLLFGERWGENITPISPIYCNYVYCQSLICPNYHVQWQHDNCNEVNERTFVIPVCGGFEITDNPQMMRKIFKDDEMVIANSPEEYLEKFDYYLHHVNERYDYVVAGAERVLKEFTLFHTLMPMCKHIYHKINGKELEIG